MHATRLWTVALEISVLMAQFPSPRIAKLSYDFRTLGLGYANLGALLMMQGIPYDSAEGRALCGGADRDHARARPTRRPPRWRRSSAPFPGYAANREAHAAGDAQPPPRGVRRRRRSYEGLAVPPVALDPRNCPDARS